MRSNLSEENLLKQQHGLIPDEQQAVRTALAAMAGWGNISPKKSYRSIWNCYYKSSFIFFLYREFVSTEPFYKSLFPIHMIRTDDGKIFRTVKEDEQFCLEFAKKIKE